jgi:hypothetical protein
LHIGNPRKQADRVCHFLSIIFAEIAVERDDKTFDFIAHRFHLQDVWLLCHARNSTPMPCCLSTIILRLTVNN